MHKERISKKQKLYLYWVLCALPVGELLHLCESFEYWEHEGVNASVLMRWCKQQGQLRHLYAAAMHEMNRVYQEGYFP